MGSAATVVDREREFHDHRFGGDDARADLGRWYAVAESSHAAVRARAGAIPARSRVLELGCGPRSFGWDLVAAGHHLTGIDISSAAVAAARDRAAEAGEEDWTRFEVMDAHALTFERPFDLVLGTGILHHLDLDRAMPAIREALAPGGTAVFFEPMAHNPFVRWYRRRTPRLRSADEHPLTIHDLHGLRDAFDHADFDHFHLVSFGAAPLATLPGGRTVVRAVDAVDRAALRAIPALRRYGWIVVIELRRD